MTLTREMREARFEATLSQIPELTPEDRGTLRDLFGWSGRADGSAEWQEAFIHRDHPLMVALKEALEKIAGEFGPVDLDAKLKLQGLEKVVLRWLLGAGISELEAFDVRGYSSMMFKSPEQLWEVGYRVVASLLSFRVNGLHQNS